jgi:hypothetical protein
MSNRLKLEEATSAVELGDAALETIMTSMKSEKVLVGGSNCLKQGTGKVT